MSINKSQINKKTNESNLENAGNTMRNLNKTIAVAVTAALALTAVSLGNNTVNTPDVPVTFESPLAVSKDAIQRMAFAATEMTEVPVSVIQSTLIEQSTIDAGIMTSVGSSMALSAEPVIAEPGSRTESAMTPAERAALAESKMSGPIAALAAAGGDGLVDVVVRYDTQPELFDDERIAELGGEVIRSFDAFEMRAVRLPADQIAELAIENSVDWLSVDSTVRTLSFASRVAANEPTSNSSNAAYGGVGVGVAVVDSGVSNHGDLSSVIIQYDFTEGRYPRPQISGGQVIEPSNKGRFDNYGHGTHVAGIVAGAQSGVSDSRGIADGSHVLALRVLDKDGAGQISDVIASVDWLLEYGHYYDIRVVNMSLGMAVTESNTTDPLVLAVERLWDAGFVVVVAAGNDGFMGNMTINSPGNSRKVITVGSLTDNGTGANFADDYKSSFSSMGPSVGDLVVKPDLLAPGNKIVAPSRGNSKLTSLMPVGRVKGCNSGKDCDKAYIEMSGTSMATPVVSAAVAMMLEKDPSLSPNTIKARLMRSARKIDDEPTAVGAGLLDIDAAMNEWGIVTKDALSPIMVRDEKTGSVYVQDTADLWGNSRWSAGYIYSGGFGWAEGNAPVLGNDLSATGFLWTDNNVWSRGFLWTDEGGSGSQGVWSRGFLWTDEGDVGARSLMESDDGQEVVIHDDP